MEQVPNVLICHQARHVIPGAVVSLRREPTLLDAAHLRATVDVRLDGERGGVLTRVHRRSHQLVRRAARVETKAFRRIVAAKSILEAR